MKKLFSKNKIKIKSKKIVKKCNLKKITYKDLNINEIEKEIKRRNYNLKFIKILSITIFSLIIIISTMALVSTFVTPILQVSGSSMKPIYEEGDVVLAFNTNNIKSGDVIAFYHGNKILIKRVIAGSGNWINIDDSGQVYINGVLLKENYVKELLLGESDIEYPYQVPSGEWFVLSDNRTNLVDSRNTEIGSVSKNEIIGKILFRIWPIR